jgi:hypothetical protein
MRNTQTTTTKTTTRKPVQTRMGGETDTVTRKRFSVSSPREYTANDGEVKTHWSYVGSAFESKNGIKVVLDSIPLNGKLYINLNPETENA